MTAQRLFQSALFTGIIIVLCHWEAPAQANTKRGSLGINAGSEIVGGFRSNVAAEVIVQSTNSQIAAATTQAAIVALNAGGSFSFVLNGGIATVAFVTTASSSGVETTVMQLNLPLSRETSISKEFAVGNRNLASRIGGVLAGVLAGLDSSPHATLMWDRAIALASQMSSVETEKSEQAMNLAASQLAGQLAGLLGTIDQLQTKQDQQALTLNEIAAAINLFNHLVNSSSPQMLAILVQQPEVLEIRSRLVALGSQFKK